MRHSFPRTKSLRLALAAAGLCVTMTAIGCQSDINGQVLPSPYYLKDDVQYFPAGPEFKLTKEAAAQKAYREEQAEEEGPQAPPPGGPGAGPGPGPGNF